MEVIPPEYDPFTKERIYRQEWLEYFHFIGWDAAMEEFPDEYAAIFPYGHRYNVRLEENDTANKDSGTQHYNTSNTEVNKSYTYGGNSTTNMNNNSNDGVEGEVPIVTPAEEAQLFLTSDDEDEDERDNEDGGKGEDDSSTTWSEFSSSSSSSSSSESSSSSVKTSSSSSSSLSLLKSKETGSSNKGREPFLHKTELAKGNKERTREKSKYNNDIDRPIDSKPHYINENDEKREEPRKHLSDREHHHHHHHRHGHRNYDRNDNTTRHSVDENARRGKDEQRRGKHGRYDDKYERPKESDRNVDKYILEDKTRRTKYDLDHEVDKKRSNEHRSERDYYQERYRGREDKRGGYDIANVESTNKYKSKRDKDKDRDRDRDVYGEHYVFRREQDNFSYDVPINIHSTRRERDLQSGRDARSKVIHTNTSSNTNNANVINKSSKQLERPVTGRYTNNSTTSGNTNTVNNKTNASGMDHVRSRGAKSDRVGDERREDARRRRREDAARRYY